MIGAKGLISTLVIALFRNLLYRDSQAFANSDRSGNLICSDVSQIQLDSSSNSGLTILTSLTSCISIVVSPPCGSSSSPAYRGSTLVIICFLHPWHLLLLKPGFSTKLRLPFLYFTACVAFAAILHFQIPATCQAVVTRPVAGHPSSVLSQAFNQSNFAILVICPHTLAGCVFWSGPETQLCFRVQPSPLAGSLTPCILHWFYKIPPHFMCSPLSVRQVASV